MPAIAEVPPPGSDLAVEQGCTCPRMDNNRGAGYLGQPGIFVFSEDCPVHPPIPLKP